MTASPRHARTLAVAILLLISLRASAQTIPDTRGTRFWMTFMPNLVALEENRNENHLFLSSQVPTIVTITSMATGRSIRVALPTPNRSVSVDIGRTFPDAEITLGEERTSKSFSSRPRRRSPATRARSAATPPMPSWCCPMTS